MNESPARIARKVRAKRDGAGSQGKTVRLRSAGLTLLALSVAFLIVGAWTIASSFIFVYGPESMIGLAIGAAIALFAVIFFVLPLLRGNLLMGMAVVVRYGIQFSEEIPLYEVAEIEKLDRMPSPRLLGGGVGLGVTYSIFDMRYTVLRSKRGIVRLKLANEMTIRNWLIPRSAKEIIFDTLNGDEVVRRFEEVRALDVK